MPLDGEGGGRRGCLLLLRQQFSAEQSLLNAGDGDGCQRRHQGNVADDADDGHVEYDFGDNNGDDGDDDDDVDDDEDDEDEDNESDSCESLATLSDNVVIWLDSEQHWVSGVDGETTCADLICALLNYQDGQEGQDGAADGGVNSNASLAGNKTNSSNNNCGGNKISNNAINQSRTTTPNQTDTKDPTPADDSEAKEKTQDKSKACENEGSIGRSRTAFSRDYVIVRQHPDCEEYLDSSAKIVDVLPSRDLRARRECVLLLRRLAAPQAQPITTTASAATQLLCSSAANTAAITTTATIAATGTADKDSGMGSPSHVGSSRSVRFCRRKHKSSATWLAQGNTLHPRSTQRSGSGSVSASIIGDHSATVATGTGSGPGMVNARLMHIIMAQDATIHRQLSQLKEKERQIAKIEEEKHFVRERELGKNYLLETYLNGLDEADFQPPELEAGVEIFIDEPYHRMPIKSTTWTKSKMKSITRHSCQPLLSHSSQHHTHSGAMEVSDEGVGGGGCAQPKEAELLHWLEKVCGINRQLQREEELLLRLHAKIRKHQVRRVYQSKQEVLQQIDQLDAQLTLKCADIQCVEGTLASSNEQLEQKLRVLERLSELLLLETSKSSAGCGGVETEPSSPSVTIAPDDLLNFRKLIAKPTGESAPKTTAALALTSAAPLRATITPSEGALQPRTHKIVDKNVLPKERCSSSAKTIVKQMFGPKALLNHAVTQLEGATTSGIGHTEESPASPRVVDDCQLGSKLAPATQAASETLMNVDITRLGTLV